MSKAEVIGVGIVVALFSIRGALSRLVDELRRRNALTEDVVELRRRMDRPPPPPPPPAGHGLTGIDGGKR